MPAPRNPWIARHRIICSIEEANPHRKLAMVKPLADSANNSLVPSARDRNPDSGIAITSEIRYEVCTHDTSVELADNPAWISVNEAETIWMSRIDMNIPNTMMRNATSRRGAMRSGADGMELITAGAPGVALDMMQSAQCQAERSLERGLEIVIASASEAIQKAFEESLDCFVASLLAMTTTKKLTAGGLPPARRGRRCCRRRR